MKISKQTVLGYVELPENITVKLYLDNLSPIFQKRLQRVESLETWLAMEIANNKRFSLGIEDENTLYRLRGMREILDLVQKQLSDR